MTSPRDLIFLAQVIAILFGVDALMLVVFAGLLKWIYMLISGFS